MRTQAEKDDYLDCVIARFGLLLSVKDVATLFNYQDAEAVRKAHRAGTLPVKLKEFPQRRGLFVTAFAVADAIRDFDRRNSQEGGNVML